MTWSASDIVARRTGATRQVFSFRAFARAGLMAVARDGTALTRYHKVAVVSLAGPFLALRDEVLDDVRPAAHPSGVTRFWTIDLSAAKPPRFNRSGYGVADPSADNGSIVTLTSLVDPPAIAAALGHDPVVRQAVAEPPVSLDDLLAAWREGAGNLVQGPKSTHCYQVDDDVLTSFAIVGATSKSLQVRIGLGGQGACRSDFTQLGLELPRGAGGSRIDSVARPPSDIAALRFNERQK